MSEPTLEDRFGYDPDEGIYFDRMRPVCSAFAGEQQQYEEASLADIVEAYGELRAEVERLRKSRDAERLRYGQQRARNAVFMQAMAWLAHHNQPEFAQKWIEKADAAMCDVRIEDFVVARLNAAMEADDD